MYHLIRVDNCTWAYEDRMPDGDTVRFFVLDGQEKCLVIDSGYLPVDVKGMVSELLKKAPEYDVLITAESKGIPLAYEMARQAGTNRYLLARKAPKLYMKNVFTVKVNSITTAKEQMLCIDQDDVEFMQGKRVLIVDDVISTGESLRAVEELVRQAGGKVAGRMAILAEGDATKRDDIIYLEKLPLFNADGTVKA